LGDREGETGQMVKVHDTGGGVGVVEVDADEAEKIIAAAREKGRLVINKGKGEVITHLEPGVEEILIVDIVEGG
jgi:hypothetical protein